MKVFLNLMKILYIFIHIILNFKNILYIFSNVFLNIHITQIQKDIINIHKCHLKLFKKIPKNKFQKESFQKF